MDVPERVHVAPVGYERDRVVLPAERLRADRVVLLEYEDETDRPSHVASVRDRLDDLGIAHESVGCDLFDFYGSIGTVAEIATAFAGDEVFVNLASGSKVTAIGGMIACMATGATPFYVRADRYGIDAESEIAEGVREIVELPTYPMEHPDRQLVAVMDYLRQEGGARKRDLIEFGKEAALPFVAEHDAANAKSEYRLLDSHVLRPLADRGDVSVTEVGRSKRVSLTASGENTLRAFSYLLDSEREPGA